MELRDNHNGAEWKRFKVYEDINRIKTDEYAELLRDAVTYALEQGYSPFGETQQFIKEQSDVHSPKKIWSIGQALNYFKQKWSERGLEEASMIKYNRAIKFFTAWLTKRGLQNKPADAINEDHIETFLNDYKILRKWSNRSYNNNLDFITTTFNFLVKKGIVKLNPCVEVSQQKTMSKKHKFYDQKTLEKIMELMKKRDPYLYFACQCVYHLCLRSEKELKHLKVSNIFPERMQVFITAGHTKTKSDRFIPMSEEILSLFNQKGILEANPGFYVFSVPHKNKFVGDGKPGAHPFGRSFFSGRFAKIRKDAGPSSDFTTRLMLNVFLLSQNDQDLQKL